MPRSSTSAIRWINIPENVGYIGIEVGDRILISLILTSESGHSFLRIRGWHLGESMFVGERGTVLSIKIEQIANDFQSKLTPAIREALSPELGRLPITFL